MQPRMNADKCRWTQLVASLRGDEGIVEILSKRSMLFEVDQHSGLLPAFIDDVLDAFHRIHFPVAESFFNADTELQPAPPHLRFH